MPSLPAASLPTPRRFTPISRAAWDLTLRDAIDYEKDLQTICFATEDAREGRTAFKEKRTPTFQRR